VSAATFASDADGESLTMTGSGVRDGLPVEFTMIAADKGDRAPGIFMLVLSDGHSVSGPLTNGTIVIHSRRRDRLGEANPGLPPRR
jgi:hypothetical protein